MDRELSIALEKPFMPGREFNYETKKWEWIGGVKRDLWAEAQREIMEVYGTPLNDDKENAV